MRSLLVRVILGVVLGLPGIAWGFPEMVRHNYLNCISCHVSPTGGGVLTPYGREISGELLSTFGRGIEKESEFAFGAIPLAERLNLMGQYRSVFAHQSTPFTRESILIFMQNDLEASLAFQKWFFVATVGYQNRPGSVTAWDHILSRRHYVNFRPTDELSIRVGRFFPAFGINTPIHVIPTKRDLGWNEGNESYNVEVAWIKESWNLYLTLDLGRPDNPSLQRDKGVIVSPSIAIGDHHKVGFSYYYGGNSRRQRQLLGAWGILGFAPNLFLLSEWDYQWIPAFSAGAAVQTPGQQGWVNSQVLDYEVTQGLHFYLTEDLSRLNIHQPLSLTYSFGAGVQFFPRPHIELNLTWKKQKAIYVSENYTDLAWIMFNFYL